MYYLVLLKIPSRGMLLIVCLSETVIFEQQIINFMIGFFFPGYAAGSVDGVVAVKYFDRGTDGDMG